MQIEKKALRGLQKGRERICHSVNDFSSQKFAIFFLFTVLSVCFVSLFGNGSFTSLLKRERRYIPNKYSYPNAQKRSIDIPSTSLPLAINESRLRQTLVNKEKKTILICLRFFQKSFPDLRHKTH